MVLCHTLGEPAFPITPSAHAHNLLKVIEPIPISPPNSLPAHRRFMTSLRHILDTHVFRPRPSQTEVRLTVPPPGAETSGTTRVNPELVARCIRAADPTNLHPTITFLSSDVPLDTLSSLLDDLVPTTALAPDVFITALAGSETHIRRDISHNGQQQCSLVSLVYRTLVAILMETAGIFEQGRRPPVAAWESAGAPLVGTLGPSDFAAWGVARTGSPSHLGILWEWKRELVLLLSYLRTFWAAGAGGVVMSLDPGGSPTLTFPAGSTPNDHIQSWCNQVRTFPSPLHPFPAPPAPLSSSTPPPSFPTLSMSLAER